MSGSTRSESSIFWPVSSPIRSPICFTVVLSSSIAEVISTGSSLFSRCHSSSSVRRTRKTAGMRLFSISNLRKFCRIGSAPVTTLSRPSTFSGVEKYGEKKNTCICWSESSASANSPS